MVASDRFPPVESLVPHRGPALLIRRVLAMRDRELRGVGAIPDDSAFANGGTAPCFAGLDLLAQATAALEALQRAGRSAPAPEIGYLVGIREARFDVATLPVGRELVAWVRLLDGAGSLSHHDVRLLRRGSTCLSAVLTTLRLSSRPADEPAGFL